MTVADFLWRDIIYPLIIKKMFDDFVLKKLRIVKSLKDNFLHYIWAENPDWSLAEWENTADTVNNKEIPVVDI